MHLSVCVCVAGEREREREREREWGVGVERERERSSTIFCSVLFSNGKKIVKRLLMFVLVFTCIRSAKHARLSGAN